MRLFDLGAGFAEEALEVGEQTHGAVTVGFPRGKICCHELNPCGPGFRKREPGRPGSEEGNADAAGTDRIQQLVRCPAQQENEGTVRWFLKRLEEGVGGLRNHAVGIRDHTELVRAFRGQAETVFGVPHLLNADPSDFALRFNDNGSVLPEFVQFRQGRPAIDKRSHAECQLPLVGGFCARDEEGVCEPTLFPCLCDEREGLVRSERHGIRNRLGGKGGGVGGGGSEVDDGLDSAEHEGRVGVLPDVASDGDTGSAGCDGILDHAEDFRFRG